MADQVQVLLVDDSVEMRESLRMLLSFSDRMQVVSEAGNGAEALDQLAHTKADVVVMDMNMPVMDGLTATEQIRRTHPNTAVVILSVQNDPAYVSEALRAGADHYLVKPVEVQQLIDTLEAAYDGHRPTGMRRTQLSSNGLAARGGTHSQCT